MENLKLLISRLESKIGKLANAKKQLNTEIAGLAEKISELTKKIEEQQQAYNELNDKYNLLKVLKTLELGRDVGDVKQKVNELVREIERCIGLLNS